VGRADLWHSLVEAEGTIASDALDEFGATKDRLQSLVMNYILETKIRD